MILYPPPQRVTFKVSTLFTSVLLAFSAQVQADDWTYVRNSSLLTESSYHYTSYTDSQNPSYTFTEDFSWDTNTNSVDADGNPIELNEEIKKTISNTYGIYVNVSPQTEIPVLTFQNFQASIADYQVETSRLIGIAISAYNLDDFQGKTVANGIHLTFTEPIVGKQLAGLATDSSETKISGSSFTFDQAEVKEISDGAEIRGVSVDAIQFKEATVNENQVTITDTVFANLATGLFFNDNRTQVDSSLNLSSNSVKVDNSNIRTIVGYRTNSNKLSISKNEMLVTGGTHDFIRAIDVDARGFSAGQLTIQENLLSITDFDNSTAEVIGVDLQNYSGGATENISGNSVLLTNSSVGSLFVVRGLTSANDSNKNNIAKFVGVNAVHGELAGFDTMEFDVAADNENEAILTLKSTSGYSFENTTLKINKLDGVQESTLYKLVYAQGSDAQFKSTSVVSDGTFINSGWNLGSFTLQEGDTLSIYWGDKPADAPEDPDVPVLDPDNPDYKVATENSKTLSESLLGTVAFINQGAEFIADEGLTAIVNSAKSDEVSTFGTVHGGSSNYRTGSRVDVDGYTLAAGASLKLTPDWILGGFIEAGWADSDSHVAGTKGEGDHDYYGVGLATRYLVNDSWYVDGSLRLGRASTDFTGLYSGDEAKYDSEALYASAHLGTGYFFKLTDSVNLDAYGRYLVTYLDGDDVNLHNKYDDKLDLDSTVTHAVRIGARLSGTFCPYAGWKVGLAYEHVFDGDAESAVNGLNLEVPSLEGNTGIMEVGVTMKPSLNSPWSMDLGAKGYAGDREGVTGNMVIRYAF